jgi:hypothetical protein
LVRGNGSEALESFRQRLEDRLSPVARQGVRQGTGAFRQCGAGKMRPRRGRRRSVEQEFERSSQRRNEIVQ